MCSWTTSFLLVCVACLASSNLVSSSLLLPHRAGTLFAQITKDLAPYAAGITADMVNNVFCNITEAGFRVQIRNRQHQHYIMQQSSMRTPWPKKDPKLLFRGSSKTGNRAIASSFKATDMVDVKVWDWVRNDNGWFEFYYPMLKHGQHFMRTKAIDNLDVITNGLTTLVQHFNGNPTQSRLVAEAGQRFATDVLSLQNIREYWHRLLTTYSELQTFKVNLHPDAIPIGVSLSDPQYMNKQ
ncbi:TPA: Protein O-glucosyltransferase 1 [Trebouxia sp. C0004]